MQSEPRDLPESFPRQAGQVQQAAELCSHSYTFIPTMLEWHPGLDLQNILARRWNLGEILLHKPSKINPPSLCVRVKSSSRAHSLSEVGSPAENSHTLETLTSASVTLNK